MQGACRQPGAVRIACRVLAGSRVQCCRAMAARWLAVCVILLPALVTVDFAGAKDASLSDEEEQLMNACAEGKPELAKQLIEQGVDVNCKNEMGETPLHVAGIWGKLETVQLLLAAGANVNAQATGPKSLMMAPLHWMVHPGAHSSSS